ncbi:MAG: hypothetical protein KC481_07250 [Acidimicrobiaceae bacterium]|nr:hypothetical protein [Acidimicrobiaceae bacterium]
MIAVSDRLADFGADVEIVVVTFTERSHLGTYLERYPSPLRFLLDPDRASYNTYGLGHASTPRIYGWSVLRRYVEILSRRGMQALRRPTEDIHQLGGDFVIDPDGVLRYARWSTSPADRPAVAALIAASHRTPGSAA